MRAILSPQAPCLLPCPISSGNQEAGFDLSWKTTLPLVPLPPPPPPPRLTTRLRLRRCRASPDERVHGIAARRYVRRSTPTRVSACWQGHELEVGSQTHLHLAKRTGLPRSPRGAATHIIQRVVPGCSSAVPTSHIKHSTINLNSDVQSAAAARTASTCECHHYQRQEYCNKCQTLHQAPHQQNPLIT
jgi:hypothetical protein